MVGPVQQPEGLPFTIVPINGGNEIPQFENIQEEIEVADPLVPLNARVRKLNGSQGSNGNKGKTVKSNTVNQGKQSKQLKRDRKVLRKQQRQPLKGQHPHWQLY